jgi:hypothetical protein
VLVLVIEKSVAPLPSWLEQNSCRKIGLSSRRGGQIEHEHEHEQEHEQDA